MVFFFSPILFQEQCFSPESESRGGKIMASLYVTELIILKKKQTQEFERAQAKHLNAYLTFMYASWKLITGWSAFLDQGQHFAGSRPSLI